MKFKTKFSLIILLLATVIQLLGCGFLVNEYNAKRIRRTMDYDKVVQILGEPEYSTKYLSQTTYVWYSNGDSIEEATEYYHSGKEVYEIKVTFGYDENLSKPTVFNIHHGLFIPE